MAVEKSQDAFVLERLEALGVTLLIDWDILVFLYRHTANLGTAAQIARLIGYDRVDVVAALQRLQSLGLIQRSRSSQGIRFCQFKVPPELYRHTLLLELMNLAQNRAGRLLLRKHLKGPRQDLRTSGLRLV